MSRTFGDWLKARRRASHLTQAELARRIHCATVMIRKIEANERHPSQQLAELLAEELAVTPQSRVAFLEFARCGFSAEHILTDTPMWPQPLARAFYRNDVGSRAPAHISALLQSRTSYLINAKSDQLLLANNGQQRMPIASTTKIMTAFIALEQASMRHEIIARRETLNLVEHYRGHSSHLQADDHFALKDALYALMLPSGDDAAFVIAESIGGTVKEFVKLMNEYARRLHLHDTFYVNPSGTPNLDTLEDNSANNYSTAADLVCLAQHALANPLFAQIVQLQRYELSSSQAHHAYTWESNNALLSSYAGATGVKTGFTREAGGCLVFSAAGEDQQLIGAVLQANGLQQRFTDAKKLLDWGFELSL